MAATSPAASSLHPARARCGQRRTRAIEDWPDWQSRPEHHTPKETARMSQQPTPEKILQTGLAFWPAKTLLSAIEMGIFTELSHGPERFDAVSGRLGLHS